MDNHTTNVHYKEEFDYHYKLIQQIEDGTLTVGELPSIWEKSTSLDDLLEWDYYLYGLMELSLYGGKEALTPTFGSFDYGDALLDYITSKGYDPVELTSDFADKKEGKT